MPCYTSVFAVLSVAAGLPSYSRERNRDPEESLLATSQGSGALFCFDFVPVATLCSALLCEELAEPQSHRSCGSLEER